MTSAQDSFWTVLHVQKEYCVAVLVEGGGIRAPVSLIYGNIAEGVGSLVGPEYLLIALWVSDTHICTHRRSIVCVRVR